MINQNIEKIKEAFFSQLSHNLMTHASNIIGFSELMKNEELRQEDKLQYIQFVIELSNMILTLAEDVKSLNKLSPESFALNESKANLNSFMDEIYNAAQNSNEIADGVRFTLRKTLRDQDATFLIDKNKIFKMLNTLLRNSFESTVSGGIEFGDSVALGVLDAVAEDGGLGLLLGGADGLAEYSREPGTVEDVVAEDQADRILSDELLPDQKGLGQSVGRGLLGVAHPHAEIGPVAQQALESREVRGGRDQQDVADPGQHQHRNGVVDHRLVVNREELFAHALGDGI